LRSFHAYLFLRSHLFSDDPPLLDKNAMNQHCLACLVQLSKLGRPDAALKHAAELEVDGMSDDAIKAAGVNTADLTLKYAQALFDRGWFRQAAFECQNMATGASPTAEQTTQAKSADRTRSAG
jgi:hypothetical protein